MTANRTPLLIADGDIATTRILARMLADAFGDVEMRTPESLFGTDAVRPFVVISRLCVPALNWLPRYLSRRRVPYCYFLDDNFWEITPAIDVALAEFYRHPAVIAALDNFIAGARSVLVMSTRLGDYVAQRFPTANVEYLVPGFDVRRSLAVAATTTWEQGREAEIRIGYPTSRRTNIASLLVPVVRHVTQRRRGNVVFEFVGWAPEELRGVDGVRIFAHIGDYDQYLAFKHSRRWDIGIAPLVGERFESFKTNVKYREYGGCQIAGIYSRVPPYVDCVVNEVTGLLVDNSVEAWIGAIERLIEDQPLREAIMRRAFSDVNERYNQQSSVSQLKTILCAIADSAGEAGKFDDVAA